MVAPHSFFCCAMWWCYVFVVSCLSFHVTCHIIHVSCRVVSYRVMSCLCVLQRTNVKADTLNPVWKETLWFVVTKKDVLELRMWDDDALGKVSKKKQYKHVIFFICKIPDALILSAHGYYH